MVARYEAVSAPNTLTERTLICVQTWTWRELSQFGLSEPCRLETVVPDSLSLQHTDEGPRVSLISPLWLILQRLGVSRKDFAHRKLDRLADIERQAPSRNMARLVSGGVP
jgi:hypothetical protein